MFKIMKYIKIYFFIILSLYSLTACTFSADQISKDEEILQTQVEESYEKIMNNSKSNIDENLSVNIQVGNKNYTGVLYDNPSTKELVKLMPMTINMSDMNSNEKFYYLPERLSTDSQRISKINTGDIMLFGSDCLVLFYEDFSTSYSYTKIGYIEDTSGFKDALGKGNVEVTFDIKQ